MHPAYALAAGLALGLVMSGCSPTAGAGLPVEPPALRDSASGRPQGPEPSTTSAPVPPPGATATPTAVTAPPPAALVDPANLVPVLYHQFDDAWAAQPYGPAATDTVRRWACGPADMAMVVATLRDSSVDVATASAWAQRNGYFTDKALAGKTKDSFFADFGNRYGVRVVQVNTGDLREASPADADLAHTEALAAVKAGDWVIALMGVGPWTTEAHYVLWYDAPGDEVLIRDSNSKKPEKARNKHSLFVQTVQRYWIVDVDRSDAVA